jgi:hypothetical protein
MCLSRNEQCELRKRKGSRKAKKCQIMTHLARLWLPNSLQGLKCKLCQPKPENRLDETVHLHATVKSNIKKSKTMSAQSNTK